MATRRTAQRADRDRATSTADPQRSVRNPWLDRAARLGLASHGFVYALIGALTIWIGLGSGHAGAPRRPPNRTVSGPGALRTVAAAPAGRVALLLLAAGLAGFAFFQVLDTAFHARKEETTWELWGHRIVGGWGIVLYGVLAAYAVAVAFSPHPSADSPSRSHRQDAELTARVMRDWPGGRLLVGAIGAVLLVSGVGLLRRAVTLNFRDRLDRQRMGPRAWRLMLVTGAVGSFGRALALGLVGGFMVAAAVAFDPRRSVGLDGTLRDVADSRYGAPLLAPLGVALICYAAYAGVEAAYRKV